jgi:hypothetical protein
MTLQHFSSLPPADPLVGTGGVVLRYPVTPTKPSAFLCFPSSLFAYEIGIISSDDASFSNYQKHTHVVNDGRHNNNNQRKSVTQYLCLWIGRNWNGQIFMNMTWVKYATTEWICSARFLTLIDVMKDRSTSNTNNVVSVMLHNIFTRCAVRSSILNYTYSNYQIDTNV